VRYSRLLLVPLVIALIAVDPPVVLFLLFSGYALSGPLVWAWLKIRKRRDAGAAGGG
jgi:CDP-diacylglycerol--serine O-phosphatidyltransferase